ncbi:MAG: excinuclease ABC subunit UvrB [Candidatus Obscuribacter sp.]|jgi:excinuclease ABC subunit B|nr:excinuclease ABC subunit UvrB [Candidatus Obscuribacter sp.]MBL0187169.1 excinuclease ABC subunit UvrB [Candidatus Obscuribacter sp.]MBP6350699.1 excinuclease ABC subunit UvrB [Candidatus Obscuribacter sp.]MBP6594197.1 excinuclease ABC subunit UvrB [Candidatus Obscuribacter sp.]MBP7576472.1 excinuclease ABC subunit UvrB [Candidatus Obscuribacter sp.]
MPDFEVVANFKPAGDQPYAIDALSAGIDAGMPYQTLLGVTGSGKTMTMASIIEKTKMPALVLAHNKTLAAQLCNEMKEFFPKNAVEYFISYYDYYQPESYIPSTDTFIEKEASINEEIDRLRHSTTRSLWERQDVIVVGSVSTIYGLGVPERYLSAALELSVGQEVDRQELLRKLVSIHYSRNDLVVERSRFRARGEILEVYPSYEERIVRVEFFGDEVERITYVNPVTGEIDDVRKSVKIYPAKHYVAEEEEIEKSIKIIEEELEERIGELIGQGKLVEAQRLKQRTRFDIEMLKEVGYCNGIENYSRILEGRSPGEPPKTLIDYFVRKFGKDGFLTFIDESHVTVPQLRGMYFGDRSRKDTLIDYGFRLPCARDNRPLTPDEFFARVGKVLFVSATPGDWELSVSNKIVEQIIRPTGLLDPVIEIRPITGQIDDLIGEIKERAAKDERILVTTLTKRMAEDLTDYLAQLGIRVKWLHSDIKALERVELLRDLRLGLFDVLVGVNLLREGLDLPEVSLVAIMEADKEGFLRAERSLIQTIGRAARNSEGKVIMYADKITDSITKARSETERRRTLQIAHNTKHGITPMTIIKDTTNTLLESMRGKEEQKAPERPRGKGKKEKVMVPEAILELSDRELKNAIKRIEKEMKDAARELDFERAADLRDQLKVLHERNIQMRKAQPD